MSWYHRLQVGLSKPRSSKWLDGPWVPGWRHGIPIVLKASSSPEEACSEEHSLSQFGIKPQLPQIVRFAQAGKQLSPFSSPTWSTQILGNSTERSSSGIRGTDSHLPSPSAPCPDLCAPQVNRCSAFVPAAAPPAPRHLSLPSHRRRPPLAESQRTSRYASTKLAG